MRGLLMKAKGFPAFLDYWNNPAPGAWSGAWTGSFTAVILSVAFLGAGMVLTAGGIMAAVAIAWTVRCVRAYPRRDRHEMHDRNDIWGDD